MLTAIRDRVSGWIAYFIVLLISIPFALWGVDQYFGGGDERLAAEVNGVEIPVQTFDYRYQQQRQYLQQAYGGELPPGETDAAIKQNVIEGMVRAELLRQETEAAGYRVGDAVLLNELTGLEVFQTDGQFDEQRYAQLLQMQGQTRTAFEQNLRQQISVSYFEDGIWESAFLPPSTRQDLRRLENQRRRIEYFVISAKPAEVTIADKAIANYYEAHQDDFQTPERVKLAYVELSEQALRERLESNEAVLRQYYRDHADKYTMPEQRRARHILIKVPGGADRKVVDEAQRRAEKLAARLEAGEDFEALAKKYSEDALSADSGGDLGFVARGDLSPAVEDVLFSLKEGAFRGPVKTELGFQIVQLVEVKPVRQSPFRRVRARVARDYRRSEVQERFVAEVEQLETLSYEQSASLEPAARALGLEVKETGWLTQHQGTGIADDLKIRAAAFEPDVLQGGYNSDVVELHPGRVVVLRVTEHEPAKSKPLHYVRWDIRQILAARKARKRAAKEGRQALVALRAGENLEAVASKHKAQIENPGFVERTGTEAPQPIIDVAFTLNKPEPQASTFGGTPVEDGYAVIALRQVQTTVQADYDGRISETASGNPSDHYGLRERNAVYEALEAAAEVEINRGNL